MKYLESAFLRSALKLGKAVSQWLPPRSEGNETILRWIDLEPNGEGVRLRYCEVFDAPEMGTYDVGELPPVNPDEPEGVTEDYSTLEAALEAARRHYGAHDNRYINASMIDSEYKSYRVR